MGKQVFNQDKLDLLESILHPLVRLKQKRFLVKRTAREFGVLEFHCYLRRMGSAAVAVVRANFIQEHRVMSRKGMTKKKKFTGIARRQMPDTEKVRLEILLYQLVWKTLNIQNNIGYT